MQIPQVTPASISKLVQRTQSSEGRNAGVLVRWRCMIQDTGVCTMYDS